MSESVEQAATAEGWKNRAEREAAALIAEAVPNTLISGYPTLLALVAAGWLQGASFGAHDTLDKMDQAFGLTKAEL